MPNAFKIKQPKTLKNPLMKKKKTTKKKKKKAFGNPFNFKPFAG